MENFNKTGICMMILLVVNGFAFAQQEIPDNIKAKIVSGINALENSKTPADMYIAVKEFTEATTIAPEYAEGHYYLGKTLAMMQGNAGKAVRELKKYLELYPEAPDKEKVNVLIVQLEELIKTKNVSSLMGATLVQLSDGIYVSRVSTAPVTPMTKEEMIAKLNLISELNKSGTMVIGKISVGDKIIKINNTDIKGYSLQKALKIIEDDTSSDKYWRFTLINGGEQYLLLMNKGDAKNTPVVKELEEENLAQIIKDAKVPVVVFFNSNWCEPCERPFATIKTLAYAYKDSMAFIAVNIDDKISTAKEFEVPKAPAVYLYKEGKLVEKVVEYENKPLTLKIDALARHPIVRNMNSFSNPRGR